MANPGGMRSMAWRAALAAALMFGFYGLALGMVAALVGPPGAPPVIGRDGRRLEPFALRASLAEEGGAERWRAFCDEAGIADADLAALASPAGAR